MRRHGRRLALLRSGMPIDLGGKSMKFVAMRAKKNVDRECVALPDVGPSVIVLDAADAELRDMNWDMRILRGKGPNGDADPEADIVGSLPVQKFRNGMVNFDQNFREPGAYVLYAKLTSDDDAKSFTANIRSRSASSPTRNSISISPSAFSSSSPAAWPSRCIARASSGSKFRIFRRRIELPRPPGKAPSPTLPRASHRRGGRLRAS